MGDNLTVTVSMSRDDWRELLANGGGPTALREAVLAAQAGEDLEDLLFDEWYCRYPVVDRDLTLTGEYADSDSEGYYNYNDEASITAEEARAGNWRIDENGGYASPPDEDEDNEDDADE